MPHTLIAMASGHSVPPLDLPKVSTAQRKLRRIGSFGAGATAAWLCILGIGASQAPKHSQSLAQIAPAQSASICTLKQKKPLFVGFAAGMKLDDFELSTLAARDIVREVKHWTCANAENAAVAVPSLQLAFARSEPMRLELVQFDDPSMASAHVLLSEERDSSHQLRWRLDLTDQDRGWAVTQTRQATAADLAEERANRRK